MYDDDDLEALEPVEPVDLVGVEPREPSRPTAPSGPGTRWLLLVAAAAVVAWVTVALVISLTTDRSRPERDARSRKPVTTSPMVSSFGSDPFGVATGRFAAVVDGRVWIVDARTREVFAARGVGRVQIVAASGASLLVRSLEPNDAGTRFVIDTRSGAAVRAADGAWIARLGGGWSVADAGGLTSGPERYSYPAGVVALAQVNAGFVVAPSNGGRLVLWNPQSGSTRALGRLPRTRLLGNDANRIVLGDPRCPRAASPHCSIEIVDVTTGRTTTVRVPFPDQFVRSAVFSSAGGRMAIWGTKGVSLIDTATGAAVRTLIAARLASAPLAFTPDGAGLLVLESPAPYRQVVVLSADTGRFVRTWVSEQHLEQVVPLTASD
jgi:hypothetical protein